MQKTPFLTIPTDFWSLQSILIEAYCIFAEDMVALTQGPVQWKLMRAELGFNQKLQNSLRHVRSKKRHLICPVECYSQFSVNPVSIEAFSGRTKICHLFLAVEQKKLSTKSRWQMRVPLRKGFQSRSQISENEHGKETSNGSTPKSQQHMQASQPHAQEKLQL